MTDDPRLTPADGDPNPLEALADVSCSHDRYYAMCCRCAADAVRPGVERLRAELAEIKRVTEPPTKKEMPTDPAELKELWEFINQQGRWQWHMAHKFGNQVERLRAELAEAKAEREAEESLVADLRDERDALAAESRARLDVAAEDIRRARQQRDAQRQRAEAAEAAHQSAESDVATWRQRAEQAEAERDAAHATIERVRELRDWLATGETMDIADRITRALRAPESPSDAPTAPTRPDDTHQPHNGPQDTPQ